jgi:uroporphyrinogen-III synthase
MSIERPLGDRRVLVTRPRAQSESLARAFSEAGAEVIRIPAFRVEAIPSPLIEELVAAGGPLPYDTVVFTSRNAVECLFGSVGRAGLVSPAEIAAVGTQTAAALERFGVGVDVVADPHTAEGLVEALRRRHGGVMTGRRVLYPKAADARAVIPRGLEAMGARVDSVTIYGALPEPLDEAAIPRLDPAPDVVTFASPSAAVHLDAALSRAVAPALHEGLRRESATACIGPVTEAAARRLGYRVEIVASPHTAAGLVDAVIDYFHKER